MERQYNDGGNDNKEQVRKLLRETFAGVPRGTWKRGMITHQDYLWAREHLSLFMPEDLHWILPRVLEELLDTHTNDDIDKEGVDYVLMKLNHNKYVSAATEREYAEIWGEEKVLQDRRAREVSLQIDRGLFDRFTREQARAVYEWLLVASCWKDVEDCADDLKGAIDYWQQRAEPGRSAGGEI